jgi:conjugal transfer pilus assembly protein TraW
LAVLAAFCSQALAQDLGVAGPVYPIAERSLLSVIEERLEGLRDSGELARLEEDARRRFEGYVREPRGTKLPRAVEYRVRHNDPSLTVPYAIVDHRGEVIHPEGTVINPLEHMTLSRKLLFFDGHDPDQIGWAHAIHAAAPGRSKPILTRGSPVDLIDAWGTWVYFDQRGYLIDRFGIEALPAMVSQDGTRLRVEEFALDAAELR